MHVEITLSTLINQLFTRTITSITSRVIFDFLNESKGVWMTEKCVSTSKQLSIICAMAEPLDDQGGPKIFEKNNFFLKISLKFCKILNILIILSPYT